MPCDPDNPAGAWTCLVTGASAGIGRATAVELAHRGARLLLVCRDPGRGGAVVEEIAALAGARPTLLVADLSSLASVRALAASVSRLGPLDALVNNAGTMCPRRTVTADGLETTFAVNHLAHFLLTTSLLGTLGRSGRVVNVCSDVIKQAARIDFDDLQGQRRYSAMRAYKQSKLAQALFTFELARRGVRANCLHPGNVATAMTARGFFIDLIRPLLPSRPVEAAARACADLATAPGTGAYFEDGRPAAPGARACDAEVARRLWQVSEALVQHVEVSR